MLQIRVKDADVVTLCVLHPREHGGLFAEVAGKRDVLYPLVVLREFLDLRERVVPAAVVDKNQVKTVVGALRDDTAHFVVEQRQHIALVVAGDNQVNCFHPRFSSAKCCSAACSCKSSSIGSKFKLSSCSAVRVTSVSGVRPLPSKASLV
ncbi:hypothetical protein SDC9_192607 [bioreactor metagenome]|uniref:Uncharacterized protein n=1 Tax=bioreactor metagenome TaxID=1076179 RepID=A0A645I1L0_9ZZZZ